MRAVSVLAGLVIAGALWSAGASAQVTLHPFQPGSAPSAAVAIPVQAGMIFWDSDRRLLQANELYGLSAWELRIARNEIYARRGKIFHNAQLRAYFLSQSWYVPRYENPQLNPIEQANVALIQQFE
jgi:hypothetical protein